MKRRLFYLMTVCALSSCGALERCPKGDRCEILFENKSDHTVTIGVSDALPDTSIASIRIYVSKIPSKDYNHIPSTGWRYNIKKFCRSGKIMIVVFNKDTLDHYPWSEIVTNYLAERRYELSVDTLEEMNWRISYP